MSDIYSSIMNTLGPWQEPPHRRAVMLEVMRVLAGFESSWNWDEGRDTHNPGSGHRADNRSRRVAGQRGLDELREGTQRLGASQKSASFVTTAFQKAMKENHPLAMEYIARLLRRTTHHNGPVVHHEIDPWLRQDAVAEFQSLI